MANTNTKRAEEAIILTMRTNTISYCIEYNQAEERNSFFAFFVFSLLHYINLFISKRKNYNGNEYKQYTGKDVIEREQESCVDRKLS